MVKEIWVPLEDERYSVSDLGRIKNNKTGRILKLTPSKAGYARVSLSMGKDCVPKIIFPHREVAKLFISNPENKPFVHHKNSNKMDPSLKNLEWVTPKENVSYAIADGRFNSKRISRAAWQKSIEKTSKRVEYKTAEGKIRIFNSISEAARQLNMPLTTCRRKLKVLPIKFDD